MAVLMEYYATATGTNARQLRFRLDLLTHRFLRAMSCPPGCTAELDVCSSPAWELAGALIDARRMLQDAAPRAARAEAIRHAELLWTRTRAELERARFRRWQTWQDEPEPDQPTHAVPVPAQSARRHSSPFGTAAVAAVHAQDRAHRYRARG